MINRIEGGTLVQQVGQGGVVRLVGPHAAAAGRGTARGGVDGDDRLEAGIDRAERLPDHQRLDRLPEPDLVSEDRPFGNRRSCGKERGVDLMRIKIDLGITQRVGENLR